MMCIARLSLIALLLCPAQAMAEDDQDSREQWYAERNKQTEAEAPAVLARVLRDVDIKFTPCLIDTQWSKDPVDAYTAQMYLGSSIYADVIASDPTGAPNDLIAPDGSMRGSFCPDNQAKALWRQMVDDFRSGSMPGEPFPYEGKPNGPRRIRLTRIKIAAPDFDRTFTTAAVVISITGMKTWRTDAEDARANPRMFNEAGYYRREEFAGGGYTYVYRKQGGHWTRIASNEDWTAN